MTEGMRDVELTKLKARDNAKLDEMSIEISKQREKKEANKNDL